jgi:hypothetical protein
LRSRTVLVRRVAAVSAALVLLSANAAGAVTAISQPHGNPYVVALDSNGKPEQFTIVATGFPAGSLVYAEQCDARATSATNWLPTRDCDIGSSPAAAIVDATGAARFPAGDVNHGLQPFTGLGPEGLFNCLTPSAPSLNNGLPEYRTCQIRVSSNNNQPTIDQAFVAISFGSAPSGAPAGASTVATSKASSSTAAFVVVGIVVLAALATAIVFARRRRRVSQAA